MKFYQNVLTLFLRTLFCIIDCILLALKGVSYFWQRKNNFRHSVFSQKLNIFFQKYLHTTSGNSCLDQGIQFFVSTDGQMQMTGSDTLDLEILWGISCQLQNFGSQIFENGSTKKSVIKLKIFIQSLRNVREALIFNGNYLKLWPFCYQKSSFH